MRQYDVEAMFAKVREQFKTRFDREECEYTFRTPCLICMQAALGDVSLFALSLYVQM